ncbi:hypothetical protein EYF80_027409 [Liparis tanakae]|uniref:Uncharacterized protein n=1 Tax=Liparis tanakae TaxID=230148 RepID=A0A4Z2H938_9TELE|nr:hypothetical protein EYF80_027409 [Liparis tanakae]
MEDETGDRGVHPADAGATGGRVEHTEGAMCGLRVRGIRFTTRLTSSRSQVMAAMTERRLLGLRVESNMLIIRDHARDIRLQRTTFPSISGGRASASALLAQTLKEQGRPVWVRQDGFRESSCQEDRNQLYRSSRSSEARAATAGGKQEQ